METYTEEELDMNNEAFWNRISGTFKQTLNMLKECAKDEGFDIDDIPEEEMQAMQKEMEKKSYAIMEHPLIKHCREYELKANEFMSDEDYWKVVAEQIIHEAVSGRIDEAKAKEQAEGVRECQEIIGWYMFQIEIKFARAFSGKQDDEDHMNLQCDANGSAKVALHGLERTTKAFEYLYKLTDHKEKYLPILSLLSDIDKMGRREFPNAPLFIRPGFDEQ
jgi:hypothetical protein